MHESLGTLEPSLSGKLGREGGQGVREANRGEFGQVTEGLGQGADPASGTSTDTRSRTHTGTSMGSHAGASTVPSTTTHCEAGMHPFVPDLLFSTLVQWLTSQNGSKM